MPAPTTDRPEGANYRWYVLSALTVVSLFSVADRLVLSILIEDIKRDFLLSDSQIGLLTGVAFSMFLRVERSASRAKGKPKIT